MPRPERFRLLPRTAWSWTVLLLGTVLLGTVLLGTVLPGSIAVPVSAASPAEDETVDAGASYPGELSREELRRRMVEDSVDVHRGRPGPASWIGDVGAYYVNGFFDWLTVRLDRLGPWAGPLVAYGTRILLVVLAVALVILLVRYFRNAPAAPDPSPRVQVAEPPPERLGLDHWRERLEEHLAEGDAVGALRALWWWWACALEARRVDPSWTTRELLQATGRGDLRALGRRFDFLAYGVERPGLDEVRELWDRLRAVGEAVPGETGSGGMP